jgi:hypothetical protein
LDSALSCSYEKINFFFFCSNLSVRNDRITTPALDYCYFSSGFGGASHSMGGGSFSATWALEFSHCTCNKSDRVFSSYWDPCPRSAAYARGGMILWSVELPSCDALSMYWGNIMKLDKLHARREIWTRVSKKLRGYFCTWKNRTKNIIQANTEKWGGFYHFMKIP